MIMISKKNRCTTISTSFAVFILSGVLSTDAFLPANHGNNRVVADLNRVDPLRSSSSSIMGRPNRNRSNSMIAKNGAGSATTCSGRSFSTSLRMSTDDFNEKKYTDAGWAVVAALTKAADYYQTSTVESPILLDLLLNPSKHKAGDDAESARRAVDKVLKAVGCDTKALRNELETSLAGQPKLQGDTGSMQKSMGYSLPKVLDAARNAMSTLGDSFVSAESLLLGLAKEDDKFTTQAFLKQDIKYTDLLDAVVKIREKAGPIISRSAEKNYDALLKYGIDFTEQAEEGKLDPVIGRDDEIRRAIQILSRRTKNNPVLIGDPGVGKTAIAEGIAQRMVAGDVPDTLQGCKLIGLDLAALVAGASMRGEFEERLKSVLEEVQQSDGEIILFIDEMHTIVGAGAASGSMDASNLLKPALARGQLRCIGATTIDEYRKYIEKDKALERRFQQVLIEEPSPEDTVSILRGLKPRYETHHGVRIRDEALLAAAKLSHRYIPDRFLPDKAIDLVDEACAKLKNELTSKPTILDEIDRRVIQLEMEHLSLQSDFDSSNENEAKNDGGVRLTGIDKELADLRSQQQELNLKWMQEKSGVDRTKTIRTEIANVYLEIEKCEREYDLNKAAELKYATLPPLVEELATLEAIADEEGSATNDEERMLRDEVTADDIAAVVAVWTGIPPTKLLEGERDKVLYMADHLRERVIGQDEAVEVVTEAVQRSRAGLNDPTKPIASMIFLGPTGVGKTELCKALSEFMFDSEDAIIRIDMSEYMEKHTVSRLLGAPPGYVGYDEGGQLTDAVRRKPYSVILFDEMEKAHPDVFNVMLQLLDDGRLTDSKGTSVNFRNTLIVFTSNVGSQEILDLDNGDGSSTEKELLKERVSQAMKDKFKPEFLNRIDEHVIFNRLDKPALRQIVKLEINRLQKRLNDKEIIITVSDEGLDYLTDIGFDPVYGARPLKRTIQKELETVVARGILDGRFGDGDSIMVDVFEKKLDVYKTTYAPTNNHQSPNDYNAPEQNDILFETP